jgi:UDP:flavonoid glycosyltransferase YjiC (YdhE family)
LPVHETFAELVTAHGLEYVPLTAMNPQDFINQPVIQDALARGRHLALIRTVLREAGPLFAGLFDSYWQHCQDAEMIISSMAFFGAYDSAQALDIPCVHSLLIPSYPTSAFPSPAFAHLPSLGGAFNRLTHLLLDQVWWQAFRISLNRWRKSRLNLPPHPLAGPYREMRRVQRIPTLLAYSPSVLPRPTDWPSWNHVVGYWFLDPPPGWAPPSALRRFMDAGPPPVYIGFGSMGQGKADWLARIAREALERCGQRGIVLSHQARSVTGERGDSVFCVRSVPHAWLFPRLAAAVHHGGAGTTGASLRAGVPTVLVPFGVDQPFWAQIVHRLGAGPVAIPHKDLTPATLAGAIDTAIRDRTMRDRVADLGRQIRAEDGVGCAVDIVERLSTSWRKGVPDDRLDHTSRAA